MISPSFRGALEAMWTSGSEAKLASASGPVFSHALNGGEVDGCLGGLTFFKLEPHGLLLFCSLLKLKLKLKLLLRLYLIPLDILLVVLTLMLMLSSSKAIELFIGNVRVCVLRVDHCLGINIFGFPLAEDNYKL